MDNPRIRLAMITPAFPSAAGTVNGGVEGTTWYLCQALRDTGLLDLHVIRPFAPQGTPCWYEIEGISVHAVSCPCWQPRQLHMLWLVRRQIRSLLRLIDPDVTHVQNMTGIAAALKHEHPCVFTVHGIIELDAQLRGKRWTAKLRGTILSLVEKRARKQLRNVIAISPYTRNFINSSPNTNIWDVANPVADGYFNIIRVPKAGRVFSASHITSLKNVATLIRAFAGVARRIPGAELRLAGSQSNGAYGLHCRQLAEELGVGAQVKFLGLLTIDQVRCELEQAAIFALCSRQENAPLAIAEAMAAGVPVMAPRIGGIPWMVGEGMTGRLVNPDDLDQITQILWTMLTADNLLAMSLASKSKAEKTYRAALVSAQTIEVYRSLLKRR